MTANKNAKASHRAGGNKAPRDIPDRAQLRSHKASLELRSEHQPPPRKVGSSATDPQQGPLQRCQSASPPPISSPVKGPAHPLSDSDEPCRKGRYAKASDSKLLSLKNWSNRASTLRSGSTLPSDIDSQNRLLKSVSIGCLDTNLSLYKPLGGGKDQKENHQEDLASDGVSSNQLGWSTLSLGPASNHRSLSLSRSSVCSQSLGIRKKISEWECRKATPARMSLCLDKRPLGDRVGKEVCPSLLPSPCSEKTFDFKGIRKMSRTFSECSYPETEEEEALDKEPLPRFEKRLSKIEPASAFLRSNSRKETSAVLNRIQKIEQALKDSPSRGPPQFLSNCYGTDKVRKKSFTIGSPDDAGSVCNSKRGSFSSVVTEPDSTPGTDKVSKMKQRFSVSSESSYCPELLPENPDNTSVNPVPKPKRTFEYEADSNHKSMPSNGLSPTPASASPPPLPSTPAPPVTRRQKKESIFHRKVQNRKSFEFEDAASLQSSHTPSPVKNGTASPETRSQFSSKSTLEENAYEDIVGKCDRMAKILDEVERRREVSAALVYPFMRSLMESPFPAPGKTIKVKTFLPGAGNEVIELRRPMDSRLEHVDFDSLFRCLSVRQVIRVFASLLLERRVIFVADKLSILSSCVHAVVALLYPFSWQHTFIPVLPSSIVDIVCCPTPFLVGLLSSSLPKLKELPVEEALMVDLETDRFIRQMDDEDTLLPRKLQAALEQALVQKNDLMNQDSDSESDEESNSLSSLVSEAFIRFFLETIGHYTLFLTQNEKGERVFQREAFRKSVASKSIRRFLGVFMESQMFAGFIQDREMRKCRAKAHAVVAGDRFVFSQEAVPGVPTGCLKHSQTCLSGDAEENIILKDLQKTVPDMDKQIITLKHGFLNFLFPKDAEGRSQELLYCQHHNREPLCLFCETCAMLTCSSCHLSSHKNHRLFHVGKAIQNQQRLFESLTAQVEDKKATMKNSTKQIESRLHDIKVMRRKTENQIQMAKMIMMNEINKRANVLLEQLERITDHYKLSLEYQQHGIVDLCQQLEQVQNFINWATAHDKSIPFLYSKELLTFQMQRLHESQFHANVGPANKINFYWDASFWTKQISLFGQLTTDTAHQGFPDNVNIQRPQPLICQGLPATLHHRPVDQANEFQPCFQQLTPVYCGQCHHRPQALQEHLAQQCMHLTETNRGHTRLLQQNPMGQHELEQGRRYRRTMPYPMKTTQPWKVPQQAQLEQDQQAGMGAHLQMKQLEQNAYPVSCMLPSHSIHQQMHLHRAPPRIKAPQTHMAQQQPVVQRSHLQQMQLLQQRQMQKTEPLLPDHAVQHGVLQPSQLEQMQKVPKVLLQTQEPKLQLQPPAKPQQFQQARVGQINYIVRQQPVQPQNGVQQQSFQPAQDNGRVQQTEQLQQEAELQQHNENHGMTHASVVNQIVGVHAAGCGSTSRNRQKQAVRGPQSRQRMPFQLRGKDTHNGTKPAGPPRLEPDL
ncbi:UNVERIFIED_CONTAM: hypothetical protein FKN15_048906 [Acipenser sinensis]